MFGNKDKIKASAQTELKIKMTKKTIDLINYKLKERSKYTYGVDAYDVICGITDLAVELDILSLEMANDFCDKAMQVDKDRRERAKAEKQVKK